MKGKKIELSMTMESRSESSDRFLVVSSLKAIQLKNLYVLGFGLINILIKFNPLI